MIQKPSEVCTCGKRVHQLLRRDPGNLSSPAVAANRAHLWIARDRTTPLSDRGRKHDAIDDQAEGERREQPVKGAG